MAANEEPTTGLAELPAEPETSAQSIAAGVLADMADEKETIERPKRSRKQKPEPELEDVLPPEHLRDDDPEDESVEVDDDIESAEATDGDDEEKEPELQDELAALAQRYGVDPGLLEGAESVGEAERFIGRMYEVFYREGQARQPDHAPEPVPAAPPVQTNAAEGIDLDLSDYDEDNPTAANLKKLHSAYEAQKKELAELKAERTRARQAEYERAQQHAALEFQKALRGKSPDLFGTDKKQDHRQRMAEDTAFLAADTLIRGIAASGRPLPDMQTLADQVLRLEFADAVQKKQSLAKREAIQARTKKRLGAPARVSRGTGQAAGAKVHDGPLSEDPDILSAVRDVLGRTRD